MKQAFLWLTCFRAATAIEYSLIVGGIAVVIAAGVFLLGDDLASFFKSVGSSLAGPG